jgi:hypothetical protein
MPASYPSESPRQAAAPQGEPPAMRQTPSVPISVYRELATELKATQAMVDSLTQQNLQLSQQNQILRKEMLTFAESSDRLRQAVERSQPQMVEAVMPGQMPPASQAARAEPLPLTIVPPGPDPVAESTPLPERLGDSVGAGVSNLASHLTRLVTPKPKPEQSPQLRPQPQRPTAPPQMLYTEERLEPSHRTKSEQSSKDLSGLWLATTILLIVVSAFGAGFLIMKPLLNNSR